MSSKSKEQKGLQPKLRFPEFSGSWNVPTLGEISDRIVEKVGTKTLETVSISAGIGFVSQATKFSRDISGEQYKNYTVLNKGDFSYNKGNSKKFPQGCVYKLKEFAQVAAPNVFISFKFKKDYVADFYQSYFESNFHGEQLKKFITSGARSNGLLNISADEFFSVKLPTPVDRKEQQKISDCLSSLDELITAEDARLEALQQHKKGLMQELFPAEGKTLPSRRFPEFKNAPEWEEKTLNDLCRMQAGKFIQASEISDKMKEGFYPCYGGNGLRGYVKSYTHNGKYSLIGRQGALCGNVNLANDSFYATEHAIVVTPKEKINVDWLYYQLVRLNLNQYATGQAQPGLSVDVLDKVVSITPADQLEQQRIAEVLSSVDNLIAAQTQKIDVLRDHKKGLMQQLFPTLSNESEG